MNYISLLYSNSLQHSHQTSKCIKGGVVVVVVGGAFTICINIPDIGKKVAQTQTNRNTAGKIALLQNAWLQILKRQALIKQQQSPDFHLRACLASHSKFLFLLCPFFLDFQIDENNNSSYQFSKQKFAVLQNGLLWWFSKPKWAILWNGLQYSHVSQLWPPASVFDSHRCICSETAFLYFCSILALSLFVLFYEVKLPIFMILSDTYLNFIVLFDRGHWLIHARTFACRHPASVSLPQQCKEYFKLRFARLFIVL